MSTASSPCTPIRLKPCRPRADLHTRSVLETFTIETFDGRVGERFRVHFDPPSTVELIEVDRHGEPPEGQRVPFSLLFRGEPQPVHPQQIYLVEHDELGGFELFLVPIGPDDHGQRY